MADLIIKVIVYVCVVTPLLGLCAVGLLKEVSKKWPGSLGFILLEPSVIFVAMRGEPVGWFGLIPPSPDGEARRINRKTGKLEDGAHPYKGFLFKRTGLVWIGFPILNTIHDYSFVWNEFDKEGSMVEREEKTSKLFFSFQYGMEFETKTSSGIPVLVEFGVTIEVADAHRMLFGVPSSGEWLRRLEAALEELASTYVGNATVEELIKQDRSEDTSLAQRLEDLTQEVEQHIGVKLLTVNFRRLEFKNPADQEAATRKFHAERDQEARLVQLATEKKIIEETAEAQKRADQLKAEGLQAILNVEGASQLQIAQILANSNITTFAPGKDTVLSVGDTPKTP